MTHYQIGYVFNLLILDLNLKYIINDEMLNYYTFLYNYGIGYLIYYLFLRK